MIKFFIYSLIFHISIAFFIKFKNFSNENKATKVVNISYVEEKLEKEIKPEKKNNLKKNVQQSKLNENKTKKKKTKEKVTKKPIPLKKKEVKNKKIVENKNTKKFDDMLKDLAAKEIEKNKEIDINNKIKDLSKKDLTDKNVKSANKEIRAIVKLLMDQINDNWTRPPAVKDQKNIVIKIDIYLDPSGNVYEIFIPNSTRVQVEKNKYLKPLLDSAVRAIKKSSPFEGLQKHSYNNWKKNTINFKPFENLQ